MTISLQPFNQKSDKDFGITNKQVANQELASLRDWPLPMLMNGQVMFGESSRAGKTLQGFEPLERLGREQEYVQDGEVGSAAETYTSYNSRTHKDKT